MGIRRTCQHCGKDYSYRRAMPSGHNCLNTQDAKPVEKMPVEYVPPKPTFDWNYELRTGRVETVCPVVPGVNPMAEGEKQLREEVCRRLNIDSDAMLLLSNIQVRMWDAPIGEGRVQQMCYYKADIRMASAPDDTADLIERIRNYEAEPALAHMGDDTLVVQLTDLQIGKSEGDGTAGTIKRFMDRLPLIATRLEELRSLGRPINHLFFALTGDWVEGCKGHYAQQTYSVDRDRRQQCKIGRELLTSAIIMAAPLVAKVTVAVVGGNHGENRDGGKSFTTFGDNDDVAIVEAVAEAMKQNPDAFGHVDFIIPEDELAYAIKLPCGQVIALTHGHTARRGGPTAPDKVYNWWRAAAFGDLGLRRGLHTATILLSGHYHHLSITQRDARRTHFQAPALDGGSIWFAEGTGEEAPAGILTFVVTAEGWQDVQVI